MGIALVILIKQKIDRIFSKIDSIFLESLFFVFYFVQILKIYV